MMAKDQFKRKEILRALIDPEEVNLKKLCLEKYSLYPTKQETQKNMTEKQKRLR